MIKLINQRLFHTTGNPGGDYTCGYFHSMEPIVPFKSFMLEDTYHEEKIPGVTRIPAGVYEIKIHNLLTPLTLKHREAYAKHPDAKWFKENKGWFHIEIAGIPNYSGVYFHSGVDDSHTLGCNLPCFGFDLSMKDNQGSKSLAAVDKFYSLFYPILLAKQHQVFIDVRDEIKLAA